MFKTIPTKIAERMDYLRALDRGELDVKPPPPGRLWQVPPETGKFLAMTAAAAPKGRCIEIGSSGGYSGLWLSLAMKERGDVLTTFEIDAGRAALARESYEKAEVTELVRLEFGDARELIDGVKAISFVFLDGSKEDYPAFFEMLAPKMTPGGVLCADNAISHADEMPPFFAAIDAHPEFDSVVVPIGQGVLLARKSITG